MTGDTPIATLLPEDQPMSKVPCSTTLLLALGLLAVAACADEPLSSPRPSAAALLQPAPAPAPAPALAGAGAPASGRGIFRPETLGDETFWTNALRLPQGGPAGVGSVTDLGV